MIPGIKNATTGTNARTSPCHTKTDSGRTFSGVKRSSGVGWKGTWSNASSQVKANNDHTKASEVAGGANGRVGMKHKRMTPKGSVEGDHRRHTLDSAYNAINDAAGSATCVTRM